MAETTFLMGSWVVVKAGVSFHAGSEGRIIEDRGVHGDFRYMVEFHDGKLPFDGDELELIKTPSNGFEDIAAAYTALTNLPPYKQ